MADKSKRLSLVGSHVESAAEVADRTAVRCDFAVYSRFGTVIQSHFADTPSCYFSPDIISFTSQNRNCLPKAVTMSIMPGVN